MKVVLFDLDGVIVFRKELFGDALTRDYQIPSQVLYEFFISKYELCKTGKADLRQELMDKLSDWGIGADVDKLLELMYETEDSPIDERMLVEIQKLRKNKISCYIASDQEKYRASDLWRKIHLYFDGHFFSYELGSMKSKPLYWQRLLATQDVHPNDILYWDDDVANIDEASKHGVNAKVFTTYNDFNQTMRDTYYLT